MRYHEAANFLYDLRRFQIKPGTQAVRDLLAHVGAPQEGGTYVQVTGSNGKGSTSRMVESVLRETDLCVGLYTSPHFDDLRERVLVDGRKMTRGAVAEFVEEVKPWLVERAARGEALTFFEVLTAMAIWYFDRAGVDVAVLEVGMGGELDATSAVDPVAAAVTNVALEHTGVLGETVEEIATTKAHIAPDDRPLVTGATGAALAAVREEAGDVVTVAPDRPAGEGATADESPPPDVTVTYQGMVNHQESAVSIAAADWSVDARIPLLGAYQAENAAIAAVLARQVGDVVDRPVDEEALKRGLRTAYWPGRFEVMETDPLVVLDGAHNPAACETLSENLSAFDYDDLHLVFAAMHDKDHAGMVEALPTPASVTTCRPDLDRAEDPEVLAGAFHLGDGAEVTSVESVANALSVARDRADADDAILVVGSLYAVGEARRTWTRLEVPKEVEDIEGAAEMLRAAEVTAPGVWRMRGKAVHRVLHTRVQHRQAQYLKEELLSLDGECATSGLQTNGELVDVVMMGTMAQFKRLCEKLEGQPWGLAGIGEEIRQQLGIRTREPERGYPWEDGTAVMGVLNVTPDSFHDAGEHDTADAAVAHARQLVAEGADIVDVGGESTRPGADPVPVEEELARILPVVEAVSELDCLVSVDTRRAEVARAALDAGADILNDVTAFSDPEMRFLAAERGCPVVLMHSIDAPVVPGKEVDYDDVVGDVITELEERILLAEKAGVSRANIIVDPGLGFGKTARENFALLGRIDEFDALGCPVLVGHSHKSMFELTGEATGDAPNATVAATAMAVAGGADIVRVHDVAENVAALQVAEASADPEGFDRAAADPDGVDPDAGDVAAVVDSDDSADSDDAS